MKRFWMAALAGMLAFALAACGGQSAGTTDVTGDGASAAQEEQVAPTLSGTPEEVLAAMQQDFSDTAQKLYDEQQALFEKVGNTFDDYLANAEAIREWYELTVSETEALGERTQEVSRAYFQAVINSVDSEDDDAIADAIDAYYEAIYGDAYGDYYDAVYEDLYSDLYDQYYDGILSDAFDTEEYSDVSDARSDEYENWSDHRSDVYEAISDARSEIYDISSDAWSAYYDDEFVIDEIFRESVVKVDKGEK